MTGSTRAEKNASRLAPIPSNAEPVSIADIIKKNLEIPSKYSIRIRSPLKIAPVCICRTGIKAVAASVKVKISTGEILNIQEVVPL